MDILQDQLGPIEWLQSLPGWLTPVMEGVSAFGTDTFFLAVLPVIYWCVNPRLGLRLGLTVLVAGASNQVLKLAFHQPRPYWIDPGVRALAAEGSFGLPSGHAQISTAAWGLLAATVRRAWAWWGAAVIVLLIGVSRVYLGVHFITDVVAGVALGLVVLLLAVRLEPAAVAWWRRMPLWGQLVTSAALSGALIGVALLANLPYAGWTVPPAWSGAREITPESLSTVAALAGGLLGTLGGASILWRLGWFVPSGPFWRRALCWVIGSAVTAGLWLALRGVPDYPRYALLALWVQLGAPLTFRWLGLVPRSLDSAHHGRTDLAQHPVRGLRPPRRGGGGGAER
ncbi:MAG: phosphatase PAP2 family protein [Nonomuraea sp.]|nr:phosphatase PAP2 family protein [Nonomuraea sp.]